MNHLAGCCIADVGFRCSWTFRYMRVRLSAISDILGAKEESQKANTVS